MRRGTMKVSLYVIVACLMLASVARAHGGALDELGCDNAPRRSNYHCHRGPLAGQTFRSKAEAQTEWRRLGLPRPPKKKHTK